MPGLDRDDLREYAHLARDLCEDFGASLLVNADIALAREMGVGVHLRAAQLAAVATRPLPAQSPVAASCHNAQELAQAQALGRSEEHTSELQSLMRISYAVFCLKKKIKN